MKKILISGLLLLSLVCCKKNTAEEQSLPSPVTQEVQRENLPNIPLKIYSAKALQKHLAAKDNDTLYVTNFFATWCPPCVAEIPGFVSQMQQHKNEKIKFTFISVDDPSAWNTTLKSFAIKNGIYANTYAFDISKNPDFAKKNTQSWDGGSIPFTLLRKGKNTEESVESLEENSLAEKIKKLTDLE